MDNFLLGLVFVIAIGNTVYAQNCIPEAQRIDCYPQEGANEQNCLERGCLWCPAQVGTPWCHLPTTYGYRMIGEPVDLPNGIQVNLSRATNISYVGGDAELITATFDFQSDERLRIKVTDGSARFEVPLKINPPASGPVDPLYNVEFSNDPVFSFRVIRKATGTVIFDTSLGGLTFADQFIQIGIKIPSINAYGIGENEQHTYRHSFNQFQTMALWARDQGPDGNYNMYGVHPYYTVVEPQGSTHSVAIINSNAQEFILSPAPGYTYRTIGGLLDIYIFMGPTPEDTVKQFSEAIGRQPIPPYWSLGFQLCRWGYGSIENMKAAVQRTRDANIPQDIQYADIDAMERQLDFTYDEINFAGLPEYIAELKEIGIKFIPIVDPGIKFDEPNYEPLELGNEMDVWVKRQDGSPVIGVVWPGEVYFPDFSRNSTREWWSYLLNKYKQTIDYDGIWIDMNEVANWGTGSTTGCDNNSINNPPYVPGIRNGILADLTLCPDFPQDIGINYDTHSLYGWSESEATFEAMRTALGNKRGIVLTRSTFLGVGKWAAHWLGDNNSEWDELYYSIIGLLQFNTFAIPYAGADICGFGGDVTEELCTRWQQVGAFYPFSRNHNAIDRPDQDPGIWGELSRNSSREALNIRYTLLPYLYYLFYQHRVQGSTVVRALWHEFTTDPIALGIDRQFLWGPAFLITPVLNEGATTVVGYFSQARWYSYHDGRERITNGMVNLDAPLEFINLHIRGGYILPTQDPALNTMLSRENPFGLIVALSGSYSAEGGMYYDDGDSVEPQDTGNYFSSTFSFSNGVLNQTVTQNGYPEMSEKVLGSIRLLGTPFPVSSVLVNGAPHLNFTTLPSGEVKVNNLNVQMNTNFTVAFS